MRILPRITERKDSPLAYSARTRFFVPILELTNVSA